MPTTLDRPGEPFMTPEALCATYADRVIRFAAMVAPGNIEAEDIAQDALERAIRKIGQFDPRRGSIENWLWGIVINAARDAGRIGRRRLAIWERAVTQFRGESSTVDVEAFALDHLADVHLLAEVRRLPQRDRAIVGLRFGADLDFATIGLHLGMTPGTASMALRRALQRLRKQLEANS